MPGIYLDYAATTPTSPEVVEAMLPYFSDKYGNPSSVHSMGEETRDAVQSARVQIASMINCKPAEVIFTGGGTESNNSTIKGVAFANQSKGNHIVTTAIEHQAVLEPCKFLKNLGFEEAMGSLTRRMLKKPLLRKLSSYRSCMRIMRWGLYNL